MKLTPYIFLLVGLLLCLVACAPTEERTDVQDEPAAITAAENEPTPVSSANTPQPESGAIAPAPIGFLIVDQDTDLVQLVDREGKVIDEWVFPGLNYGPQSERQFHFGGRIEDGLIDAPCIYLSTISGNPQITYHRDKALIPLQKISQLISLVGAPGSPQVAYAILAADSLQRLHENQYHAPADSTGEATKEPVYVHSWIYAGSQETLEDAQAIVFRADENGLVLYPLALKMEQDELLGVWYTLEPHGMSGLGPIFYRGYSRLFFTDLQAGQTEEVLGVGFGTLALSPDQTKVAYEHSNSNGTAMVTIYDLNTEGSFSVEVLPQTHPTGVGNAHFSPSGERLAWHEIVMGDDTIFSIIRVASPKHDDLIEFDARNLESGTTSLETHNISLAGWLDEATLLIEVYSNSGIDLYRLGVDNGELTYLVAGDFIEFVYP